MPPAPVDAAEPELFAGGGEPASLDPHGGRLRPAHAEQHGGENEKYGFDGLHDFPFWFGCRTRRNRCRLRSPELFEVPSAMLLEIDFYKYYSQNATRCQAGRKKLSNFSSVETPFSVSHKCFFGKIRLLKRNFSKPDTGKYESSRPIFFKFFKKNPDCYCFSRRNLI